MTPTVPSLDHIHALARQKFGFFARGAMKALLPATDLSWNWHLDLLCNRLEDVLEGRTQRLIINIPPRHGKSLIASVSLPAYILGLWPEAEVVCVSYAQGLTDKMASDTRRLMNSRFYQELFGPRLISPRAKLGELKTGQGGSRLATSVDGTLTGRGGDFIILDDPLNPGQAASETRRQAVNDWYDRTVPSRPNNKASGAIIVIMQRLHEDDLVGHLRAQGHWDVLSLPAIAEVDEVHDIRTPVGMRTHVRKQGEALHPERESLVQLEQRKSEMGSYDFAAQYQQRPAPRGGGVIKVEWFRTFDPEYPPEFFRIIQSWDTASKDSERSDYSVCTTWGQTKERHNYLLDVYRARLLFPDLKRKVRQLAELQKASHVLIEDTASGIQLIQEQRLEGFANIQAIKAKGSKYERMIAQTAAIEAGKVWIPNQAHWRDAFLDEAALFPNVTHDDQIDSMSQGLGWLNNHGGPEYWLWVMDEVDRRRGEGDGL